MVDDLLPLSFSALHLDPSIADAKEQVRDLTHRLDVALHSLTINAPGVCDLRMIVALS